MNAIKGTFRAKLPKFQMLASLGISTVAYALSRGVNMADITAKTGIQATDLFDPSGRLPQEVVPKVWKLLNRLYPGKVLSLHMASAAPFSFFGPLAYGGHYAQNLREALEVVVRYRYVLSEQLHLTLEDEPVGGSLQFSHPMDALDGGCGAEAGLGVGVRYMRELLGHNDFLDHVEFSHRPFGPLSVYEDFFGVPVQFQQPHNAMVFVEGALDWSLQQPNPELFRYIQEHLDLVKQSLVVNDEDSELTKVRVAIAENAEHSEYRAEALAQRLNMSLRSLQRLAQRYNFTVRQLLDDAREANARQFLSDKRLSVEAISFLLGYSEASAFRRAFKRWTGVAPAEYRESLQVA